MKRRERKRAAAAALHAQQFQFHVHAHEDGQQVVIDLGTPVAWIAASPETADQMAAALTAVAAAVRQRQQEGTP